MSQVTRIFTDGSAIGNPGPGGWAAIILHERKRYEMFGSEWCTTIQEMELFAAVRALSILPPGSRVEPHSDSEYLIKGMKIFVLQWIDQGWRNRRGRTIQTKEVWRQLLCLSDTLKIDWRWVRGHSGDPEQTCADALAYRAARSVWMCRQAASSPVHNT